MTEHERRAAAIASLHRMIIYVREEALRLRLTDVALLIDHAEEAIAVFDPAVSSRFGLTPSPLDTNGVEH